MVLPLDRASLPYMQAYHYTPAQGREITLVVIHTAECPQAVGAARGVGHYFGTPESGGSTHYGVDSTEIIHYVQEKDIAWGAPNANHQGIHIEHAGYAASINWDNEYSTLMLSLSEALTASVCHTYGIPAVWLSPEDVAAGKHGITSHYNITMGLNNGVGHTDPGLRFPAQVYCERVAAILSDF